jgi:hypothetical protein
VRAERDGLEAQLATLAEGKSCMCELGELPLLVEDYLKEGLYLMERMPVVRRIESRPSSQKTSPVPRALT